MGRMGRMRGERCGDVVVGGKTLGRREVGEAGCGCGSRGAEDVWKFVCSDFGIYKFDDKKIVQESIL